MTSREDLLAKSPALASLTVHEIRLGSCKLLTSYTTVRPTWDAASRFLDRVSEETGFRRAPAFDELFRTSTDGRILRVYALGCSDDRPHYFVALYDGQEKLMQFAVYIDPTAEREANG